MVNFALRLSRWLARHADNNRLPLQADAGVVSFTFDDVPASACVTGAQLLEQHGQRGTFYVAGALTGQREAGRACHTHAQLRTLLAAGHELGCHTYSHVRCDALSARALTWELERNAAFLAALGVDAGALDFAYPFGAYAYAAKRICSRRFRSSRITGGGMQAGQADLNALKTFRLYAEPVDADSYETVLARTARDKGWLIVNTHDVADAPSAFGCTPQRLEHAIVGALAAGCNVLPVSAAIDYWRQNAVRANA